MITKEIALTLRHGQILHNVHKLNSSNEPTRCRVNGQCKVWKTRPNDFQLPVKAGLYEYGYITPENAKDWTI